MTDSLMTNEQRVAVEHWIVNSIKMVGFPIVMCSAFAWACYQMITWEREQMIPTINNSTKAIDANSTVLQGVKKSLDSLNKTTQRRVEQETPHETK